jgi:6-phosphogluconolactonase (cycloisomerase 2 family)
MSRYQRRILELSLALSALACGGGGGGGGGGSNPVVAPSDLSYPSDPSIYVVDLAIDANTPSFHGAVDQFTVDPPLPLGLTIDHATGALTGTPEAPAPRAVHTITASNAGGNAKCELSISVVGPARFAYTISDDSTISMFSASALTGRLQRKGYIVADAGEKGPEQIVVHPSSKFVYVPNAISSNVSMYAVDPASGWLAPGAPIATGGGPHRMVVDPTGRFAYVACRGADQVRAYSIHPLTGALTALGNPVSTGAQPSALAWSDDLVFVTLRGNATSGAGSAVSVFRADPQSGALSSAGPGLALGSSKPADVTADSLHHELCVVEEATASIAAIRYDVATGALEPIGSQPLAAGPSAVSMHPAGGFAYASTFAPGTQSGDVSIFRVDSSGALGVFASASTGKRPACITLDAAGTFAYVAGHDSSDISVYAIDRHTGAWSLVDNLLTRVGPNDLAIVEGPHVQSWTPRFVHVTNSGSDDISAFRIDPVTGALTEVGARVPTGISPISLAIDPKQRFVYVASQSSSNVSLYLLSPSTGALFEVNPTTNVAGQPTHIAVDPSGRFAYLTVDSPVGPDFGSLLAFSVHPTLGLLSPIDAQPLQSHPTWVTVDPTGQYLYVANSGTGLPGTGTVAAFRLPVSTGIPVSVASSQAPGVNGLGCHASGKYIYAMLEHSNAMIEFTVDVSNGALTLFPSVARAGLEPTSVASTPDGRFAYVSFANSQSIGHTALLPIDPATGFLITPAFPVQGGLHPIDLAVDPSGRFLYVANSGSDDVSLMTIDPTSGELTVGASKMCGLAPSAILVTGVTQ